MATACSIRCLQASDRSAKIERSSIRALARVVRRGDHAADDRQSEYSQQRVYLTAEAGAVDKD